MARRRKRSVPIRGDLLEDGPGNAAERESRFLWLENAIDSELNETQRYIIRRHEYESAPLNEIAKELKMQRRWPGRIPPRALPGGADGKALADG